MMRLFTIAGFFCVFGFVIALYHVRYSAQGATQELRTIQLSLTEEQARRATLLAEWNSLNDPRRLQYLSSSLLDLQPPDPKQIVPITNVKIKRGAYDE